MEISHDFPPLNSLSAAALQQERFHYTGSSRGRLPLPSPDVRKMVDEATCWCFSWDGHPDAASDALVGMWIYHDISIYIYIYIMIYPASAMATGDLSFEFRNDARSQTRAETNRANSYPKWGCDVLSYSPILVVLSTARRSHPVYQEPWLRE